MPVRSKRATKAQKLRPAQVSGFGAITAPITTFVPEPYDVLRPVLIVVQRHEDTFVASFFDVNIHASGDTEEEAFRNLKSLILDVYDSLIAESPENLGPEPKRQLAVLREFIYKKS